MDSFYEQPRSAPVAASIEEIPSCKLVADVSVCLPPVTQSKPKINENKATYKVWKKQNQCIPQIAHVPKYAKENINSCNALESSHPNISKALRKQVRFNSSHIQREVLTSRNTDVCNKLPDNIKFKQGCREFTSTKQNNADKTFDQIYMANIPNRHLDLSIIDSYPYNDKLKNDLQNKNTTKCLPQEFNEGEYECFTPVKKCITTFQQEKDYDSQAATNELNYTVKKLVDQSPSSCNQRQTVISHVQGTPERLKLPIASKSQYDPNNFNNEPTVRELLKVVQQQNEQILLLQKQVSLLLQNQSLQKQIEMSNIEKIGIPQNEINNVERESMQYNRQGNPKTGYSKFAVDVMTSFEVSIRPPSNFPCTKFPKETNTEAKIQEIVNIEGKPYVPDDYNRICEKTNHHDSEKNRGLKQNDLSLILNEPFQIAERCPSPESSIHVDMKDYSSDSDEESTGSSTDIGWTIYNNVMGQVNNILQKANNIKNLPYDSNGNIGDKTLQTVEEATMQHLRTIGVNLPILENGEIIQRSIDMENNSKYGPTEISFAVKQLLMKYLPDEQLAKLTQPNSSNPPKKKFTGNAENLIKKRPEFSFATLQYMKKYNLLTSDSISAEAPQKTKNTGLPRILDVTTLKQQPKLL